MSLFTRKYIDLDLDFMPNPITGDILKKFDENAVGASLTNLLQTGHYERLFQPQVGCNLKRYLFEPIDGITTNNIRSEIQRTIKNFEPRVTLLDTIITPDYDNNGYTVSIKFFINNDAAPITISFFLERVR